MRHGCSETSGLARPSLAILLAFYRDVEHSITHDSTDCLALSRVSLSFPRFPFHRPCDIIQLRYHHAAFLLSLSISRVWYHSPLSRPWRHQPPSRTRSPELSNCECRTFHEFYLNVICISGFSTTNTPALPFSQPTCVYLARLKEWTI